MREYGRHPERQRINCASIAFFGLLLVANRVFSAEWISLGSAHEVVGKAGGANGPAEPTINVRFLPHGRTKRRGATAAEVQRIEITVDLPGIFAERSAHRKNIYSRIHVPGWGVQPEAGKPAVPVKPLFIEIPAGTVPTVRVTGRTEMQVAGVDLWPTQPALPESGAMPPFRKDSTVYETNQLFPEENILGTTVIWMRNHRILVVNIAPVRVNPARHTALIASRLELDVVLEQSEERGDAAREEPGLTCPAYDAVMCKGVYGYRGPEPAEDETAPTKYLVLLADQFQANGALAAFVEWKRLKGCDVELVRTSDIEVGGGPSADRIWGYLLSLPAEDYPTYLLVIGDEDQWNGVRGHSFTTVYDGYTDLYFSCRTVTDYVPDLFCGRLPASNNAELTSMLEKILEMDRNPPASSMYGKAVVAGCLQDHDPQDNRADRHFCETMDAVACYFEQNTGYTCARALVNPDDVTPSCHWREWPLLWEPSETIGTRVHGKFVSSAEAETRVEYMVNDGVAIVQYRGHGGVRGWWKPYFRSADVTGLWNGQNRPLVFSCCCLTGAYHEYGCFAEAWLNCEGGGAYAVIAATDVSYSGYNDWLTHGFYMAFLGDYRSWHNDSSYPDWTYDLPEPDISSSEGSTYHLGGILNFGKMYVLQRYGVDWGGTEDTFKLHHLFGDPEAYLQLHVPAVLSVNHPNQIATGPSSVTVTADRDGAAVCLLSESLGVHTVGRIQGGSTTLDVNPTAPGTMYVTVTGFGIRPYEGSIEVGYPVTPVITSAPSETAFIDTPYYYDISASGYPPPTYSVFDNPAWLTLDGSLLSGTPHHADLGVTGVISVCATNSAGSDLQPFHITVFGAPVIESEAPGSVIPGRAYSYSIRASGYPPPTYSVTGNPPWLTLTGNLLSGTPQIGDLGVTGPITVTATNSVGSDTQEFRVIVLEPFLGDNEGCGCRASTDAACGPSFVLFVLGTCVIALALRLRNLRRLPHEEDV